MSFILKEIKLHLLNHWSFLTNKINVNIDFQPFFIIGSGRNGSTLVSTMLNIHQGIYIAPEQYGLAKLIYRWHYFPYKNQIQKIEKCSQLFLAQSYHWKTKVEDLKKMKLDPKISFQEYLSTLYETEALNCQKSLPLLLGDKTPHNIYHVFLIQKILPQARFIFLQRDPRDVIASHLKMEQYQKKELNQTLKFLIWRWKNSWKNYLKLKKIAPVHFIQYETFVKQQENELRKVFQFLKIEFDSSCLIAEKRNRNLLGLRNEIQHQNINNNITANSVGRWKELDKNIIREIEKELSEEMKINNYL